MSAGAAVQAALAAALEGIAGLAVFDAPPVRATLPHAIVGEALLGDWGAKGLDGREGRVAIAIHDAGERPVRLRGLLGEVEAAVAGLGPVLGDGWRLANARVVRSRVTGGAGERWTATCEVMVRVYRGV